MSRPGRLGEHLAQALQELSQLQHGDVKTGGDLRRGFRLLLDKVFQQRGSHDAGFGRTRGARHQVGGSARTASLCHGEPVLAAWSWRRGAAG